MGKKDIVDRPYFSEFQRFAEIVNAALYHGENVILPENLTLLRRKYPSLTTDYGELERDVFMKDESQNICYGIEIETESDYRMPERVITYDACEYEYQIREIDKGHRDRRDYQNYRERKSRMKRDDILLPSITIVLFLGEGHWEGRCKLSQMFCLSQKNKDLLTANLLYEYEFPLIEADYTTLKYYRTDLKEFFQAMQCRRDKMKLKMLFQTKAFMRLRPETEQIIARHLHVEQLISKMEKEKLPMCKAFNDLIKEERKEERREERIRIIQKMMAEGVDETFIRKVTGCTKKEYLTAAR